MLAKCRLCGNITEVSSDTIMCGVCDTHYGKRRNLMGKIATTTKPRVAGGWGAFFGKIPDEA